MPAGTFVHLQAVVSPSGRITPERSLLGLTLTNLESFGGEDNPTESGERLWVAVNDGGVPFAPVEWGKTKNVCQQVDRFFRAIWDLEVSVAGESVIVGEGTSEVLTVPDGAHQGTYRVTNLLSHSNNIEGPAASALRVERD